MPSKSELDIANKYPPSTRYQIDHARGAAISQYAHLESELSNLFSIGFETPGNKVSHFQRVHAGFAFRKIGSSRARNEILESAIRWRGKHIGGIFYNSLFKELDKIDKFRNHMAHWTVYIALGDNGERHFIVPPNGGIGGIFYSVGEIHDWVMRMRFTFYLFCVVRYSVEDRYPEWASQESSNEILRLPVSYPPPSSHPLVPIWKGPTVPPQS